MCWKSQKKCLNIEMYLYESSTIYILSNPVLFRVIVQMSYQHIYPFLGWASKHRPGLWTQTFIPCNI